MKLLDLTLPSAAENVALDEALLEEAEAAGDGGEVLRLWESQQPVVVMGRSTRLDQEVQRASCVEHRVPILRRTSGGGAIVAGPGCLMYAVVLNYERNVGLRMIEQAHRFVLQRHAQALQPLHGGVVQRGISDLALGELKFSGNSLRCKRTHLLYHGTLLYDFPLEWISRYLGTPAREPDYRHQRAHQDFVTNFSATAAQLRAALRSAWPVDGTLADWPRQRTARLVQTKYAQASWTERL